MRVQISKRRWAWDSLWFDVRWCIRHAIIGRDAKSARWYWRQIWPGVRLLWRYRKGGGTMTVEEAEIEACNQRLERMGLC